jgi:ubiquitin
MQEKKSIAVDHLIAIDQQKPEQSRFDLTLPDSQGMIILQY